MVTFEDYSSNIENQWCPGCSNFKILTAMKHALLALDKNPQDICLVSGIGQAAKLPHYLKCNLFNGLHGRALPIAVSINIVNPELTTIVVTGDGDCYGEGGNHFLHTIRRNPDITLIVHNNQIYGLTKGQASPTTDLWDKTRLQFEGVELEPLLPLATALFSGCSFIARGYAGDIKHLSELFFEAIRFKGFSYVDVIQPCNSYGTHNASWYQERMYKLPDNYDFNNKREAMIKTSEWGEKIPIGILYKNDKQRRLFGDHFKETVFNGKLTELGFPPHKTIIELMEEFR
jgi:2-oxoglutarate ferredoxin oxidoreductase subunit beta